MESRGPPWLKPSEYSSLSACASTHQRPGHSAAYRRQLPPPGQASATSQVGWRRAAGHRMPRERRWAYHVGQVLDGGWHGPAVELVRLPKHVLQKRRAGRGEQAARQTLPAPPACFLPPSTTSHPAPALRCSQVWSEVGSRRGHLVLRVLHLLMRRSLKGILRTRPPHRRPRQPLV